MTAYEIKKPNWKIALGIPGIIFLSSFFISLTKVFKNNSELISKGILIDILIVAPIIYFFAIRKSDVPKTSVSRVFILGLLVAGLILNAQTNPILHIIKTWVSPVIEAVVIFYLARKFYVANKKTKAVNGKSLDFLVHCRALIFEVTGNRHISNIISSEVSVFYYAFLSKKDKAIDYKITFTSYKENGVIIVLWLVLSVFIIETASVHLLLILWNKIIAWIITALSIYTCIQLFAHIRAIKARPIIINGDALEIHNGLAGDALIRLDNIEYFEISKKIPQKRNSIKVALLNGLENHNIVVYLKSPIEVTKFFGLRRYTDTVLFFVDKPKYFSDALSFQIEKRISL